MSKKWVTNYEMKFILLDKPERIGEHIVVSRSRKHPNLFKLDNGYIYDVTKNQVFEKKKLLEYIKKKGNISPGWYTGD